MKKEHIGGPSDIWSLGVILFILLTGKFPFSASFEDDLYRKISSGKYKWPDFLVDKNNQIVELSNGAKNLVNRILVVDQKRRPTAR